MTAKITWVVICNATIAHIYNLTTLKPEAYIEFPPETIVAGGRQFRLIHTLRNPLGRLKNIALVSDKPGRYKTLNKARGQYSEHISQHDLEHKKFARKITRVLLKNYLANHYQYLILCAEPHFYGLLKSSFPKNLEKAIKYSIKKDYIPLKRQGLLEITRFFL